MTVAVLPVFERSDECRVVELSRAVKRRRADVSCPPMAHDVAERCADVRARAMPAWPMPPNRTANATAIAMATAHRTPTATPHFHAGGGTATTTLRPSGSALKARAIERRGKNDDFRSGTEPRAVQIGHAHQRNRHARHRALLRLP